ncbi:B3 domain-containing transcription repressor VAL2 [Zea mays]|uniref:B3 domain-containing transcription repressor VAL2 n=1 Tax=Zea mays TaxID=4577 RepID=A0A1D6P0A3_MAIZE|nr:B3 domain-containing transcription repressor VAL2 [Zea mays]
MFKSPRRQEVIANIAQISKVRGSCCQKMGNRCIFHEKGLAYEQFVFCDIFHQKESGWRDCSFCGKRLHYGCVASKNSYDLLDSGGIQCVTCMKNSAAQSASGQVVPKLFPFPNNLLFFGKSDELLSSRKFGQPPSLMLDSRNDDIAIVNKSNHLFMVSGIEAGQSSNILRQKEIGNGPRQIKWEQPTLNIGDMGRPLLTRSQSALESPQCTRRDDNKDPTTDSTTSESFPEACLSMNLGIANNGNRMEATSIVERPMI